MRCLVRAWPPEHIGCLPAPQEARGQRSRLPSNKAGCKRGTGVPALGALCIAVLQAGQPESVAQAVAWPSIVP